MKNDFSPIELSLYDENDEVIRTYSKSIVRWGILKQAIKLAKILDESGGFGDSDMDAISAFVCRLFDDQFTVEELAVEHIGKQPCHVVSATAYLASDGYDYLLIHIIIN